LIASRRENGIRVNGERAASGNNKPPRQGAILHAGVQPQPLGDPAPIGGITPLLSPPAQQILQYRIARLNHWR
jgi:hypothetical protein